MPAGAGEKSKSVDVEAMARAMALLFYCMADEFVKRYGDEGRHAVRAAIARFGEMRGRSIRSKADEAGLDPGIAALGSCYDLPLDKAWNMESTAASGRKVTRVFRCPMARAWKEIGAEEIGKMYCEVDPALVRGFNPSMAFRHERNTLNGDNECVLVYEETSGLPPGAGAAPSRSMAADCSRPHE